MRPTPLRTAAMAVAATTALLTALPATAGTTDATPADEGPGVRVEQVQLQPDGTSQLIASITGLADDEQLAAEDVTLVENGSTVAELQVGPLTGEPAGTVPAVVLAVDVSGSTEGEPLAAAVDAAAALTQELEANRVATGLVSFGPRVDTLVRTDDPAGSVVTALPGLVAEGGTALYDGIARSARMLAEHDGPRDLVIFSDGVDTVSGSSLTTARELAEEAELRVTAVALDTGDMDLAPLRAITDATEGQLIRVVDPDQLLAVFRDVAVDLTNRYVVSWTTAPVEVPPSELVLSLQVATAAATVADDVVVLNPRSPVVTPPEPYSPPAPPVAVLGNRLGLVVGAGTTFLALLLLGVLMFGGAGERRRRERLAARLEHWDGIGDAPEDAVQAAASLSERAADAVDRLPKPRGLEERVARLLERADWPMRPSEFLLVTAATTFGGLVVPLVLTRNVPLGVLGMVLGAVGPTVALRMAVERRSRAFEDQLPHTLGLLAGALRAGHAFTTALEGAVRESDDPVASELRRAAVEHRLGRSVAEALRGVAHRMHSTDLRWVVNAIEIQQEVGGNLAELLDNVAATLRDRASMGRTVKALSAEGRYSAWIIGGLPVAMFAVMLLINRDYVEFLYTDPRGVAMLVLGAAMMLFGILMLRRIVQPRF